MGMEGLSGTAAPASSGIGGSTGATTNALLKSSGTGGATLQATGIIVDSFNQMSGWNFTPLALDNETWAMTAADGGKIFTTVSGDGASIIALPTGTSIGQRRIAFAVAVIGPDRMTLQANTGQTIYIGSTASSVAGTAYSVTLGSIVYVFYAAINTWLTIPGGTWVTT